MTVSQETIAAIATPTGRGGIGIVRISGPDVTSIAQQVLGQLPPPRYATFTTFVDTQSEPIDQGIALYYPPPHSFTGEAVLELQGHGSPVVMDYLLQTIIQFGARLARPGEFSERAFLNGKIDLAQAEAIADLIDCTSRQAARCALRSLQGQFSQQIHDLVEQLIGLRSYVEADIDFVDEEIDLLSDGQVATKINQMIQHLENILDQAQQGYLLKEGIRIVLVGEPNVGKSSLLNCLSGRETAIVTPIPGTTRDIVTDFIQIDGMPLHIIDTAGLRETIDIIEQEGIRRTKLALQQADLIIFLLDERSPTDQINQHLLAELPTQPLIIRNKIDISGHPAGRGDNVIYLSAKTGQGIEDLINFIKEKIGLHNNTEGSFMARRRHLEALKRAHLALQTSLTHTHYANNELLAEELRQAQQSLNEITGEFSADDLLGQIFSTFCIGK